MTTISCAEACHCHGVDTASLAALKAAFASALDAERPTVIVYHEQRA